MIRRDAVAWLPNWRRFNFVFKNSTMNEASEPASAWFDRAGRFGFAERAQSIKIWGLGDVTSGDKFVSDRPSLLMVRKNLGWSIRSIALCSLSLSGEMLVNSLRSWKFEIRTERFRASGEGFETSFCCEASCHLSEAQVRFFLIFQSDEWRARGCEFDGKAISVASCGVEIGLHQNYLVGNYHLHH